MSKPERPLLRIELLAVLALLGIVVAITLPHCSGTDSTLVPETQAK